MVIDPGTTQTVNFVAGPPDQVQSTISASPAAVVANGVNTSTIAVTFVDHFGNPIVGDAVALTQGSGHSTISTASSVTNANGVETFLVTDVTNESVTYQAVDVTAGDLLLTPAATVVFKTADEAGQSTVTEIASHCYRRRIVAGQGSGDSEGWPRSAALGSLSFATDVTV